MLALNASYSLVNAQFQFSSYDPNSYELSNISGPHNSFCEIRFLNDKARVTIIFDKASERESQSFLVDYKRQESELTFYHPFSSRSDYVDVDVVKKGNLAKEIDFQHYMLSKYGYEIPGDYRLSYNGVDFIELEESIFTYGNTNFDSLNVNGYWIPISSDTLEGSYEITIQTDLYREEYVDNKCSVSFDSIMYTFDGTTWKINDDSQAPCIGQYMNNLYEKNWDRFMNSYTIDYNLKTSLPNAYVTHIIIDSTDKKQLDFSQYPSLKDMEINTSLNRLDVKLPHDNVSIGIKSLDSLTTFKLSANNHRIKTLVINTPQVQISSATMHKLSLQLYAPKDIRKLKKIPSVRQLSLNFSFNPDLTQLNINQDIKSLLISADTIHVDCNSNLPNSLDSLVLYGYSDSFDFLNCPHNLSYLGIYYLNEVDKPVLDTKYPELKKELWCFPEKSTVYTPEGNKNLRNIQVGDSVMCINAQGKISKTIVTSVEYHKVNNVELIQLTDYYDVASSRIDDNPLSFSTQFVPQHPLFVEGLLKKTFADLESNEALLTKNLQSIPKSRVQIKRLVYSGTLINISTAQGNFFIDEVCFSNK